MVMIRKTPLVTGEIYHIFNRGIDGRSTFCDDSEYLRFFYAMNYYSYSHPPIRLSEYLELKDMFKQSTQDTNDWGEKLINTMAYCYMPNHFHLLVRQLIDGGISKFMNQLLNSYTRYFNIKNKRIGQLFLDQFKNVLIENENQFTHVSRYIHLNPFSSGIVDNINNLISYKWSSFPEYVGTTQFKICDKSMLHSVFQNEDSYKKFVFDNSDYQRKLKRIENLRID